MAGSTTVPLRLGLIGCGSIAQSTHIPSYLSLPDDVRVAAVSDLVPENVTETASLLGLDEKQCFADFREMLHRTPLDVVMVATPHAHHAQHVIAAAEAGCAVVSEKPMATTLEEADAIFEAVRRAGVAYSVCHNFLFTDTMLEALRIVSSGAIGRPHLGRGELLSLKPEDFGPRMENRSLAWRSQRSAGGGCIIDTAYHEIYSVESLVGSPIRQVEARVKTMTLDVDVDDLAILMFEHDSGAISTVSSSWCAPGFHPGRWCEVHAAEGSLHVEHRQPDGLWRYDHGGRRWNQSAGAPSPGASVAPRAHGSGHREYFRRVFEALRAGTSMPVTGEMARHNLAIIEAARKATESRAAVQVVDP